MGFAFPASPCGANVVPSSFFIGTIVLPTRPPSPGVFPGGALVGLSGGLVSLVPVALPAVPGGLVVTGFSALMGGVVSPIGGVAVMFHEN